jgi:hypothetical protein
MPYKAKLVTRTEISSSVTTDSIPKNDTLTYEELDSNLINLRDQSFGLVGDDSTGVDVAMGDTIKVAGSTNIATAMSGDTLTITGPANVSDLSNDTGFITASTSDTLTNKTIDATNNTLSNIANSSLSNSTITVVGDDSTGTAISLGETFKIAGTQNITSAVSGDTITLTGPDLTPYTQNTDTAITIVGDDSTGTAVTVGETFKVAGAGGITTAVSGDTVTITGPTGTLSNIVEDTTPQLGGNLDLNTFTIDGTGNISITGNISTTGDISTDAISIADNKITTTRSNDILKLQTAGTGDIYIGKVEDGTLSFSGAFASNSGPQLAYITDTASTRLNSTNIYPNSRSAEIVLNADVTTGNRARMTDAVDLDLNGYSWTSGSFGAGPAHGKFTTIINSQATTEALGTAQALTFGLAFPAGANAGSTINVTNAFGSRIINQFSTGSNDTVNITNLYGHYYQPTFAFSNNGTATVTNDYGFYVANPSGTGAITPTNRYGFYALNDSVSNRIGGISLQNDTIKAFTADDTLKISTNGTGEINIQAGTDTQIGDNGAASALTANPVGYLQIQINGSDYQIPYYNRYVAP